MNAHSIPLPGVLLAVLMAYLPVACASPDVATILAQLGLMNKISTGYPALDVLLCMFVPACMNLLTPKFGSVLRARWKSKPKHYVRTITFRQNDNQCGDPLGGENAMIPPTILLQQAVLSAINKNPDLSTTLQSAELQLGLAPRAASDKDCKAMQANPFLRSRHASMAQHGIPQGMGPGGVIEPLQNATVNIVPANGTWIGIVKGVEFMREEHIDKEEKRTSVSVVFSFRSKAANGNILIDELVKEAFKAYQKERQDAKDTTRYLYMPVQKSSSPDNDDLPDHMAMQAPHYKRYALSNDRTFNCFFHPDKSAILRLVDDFQNKTGKFGIPGYPNKLGFLLHGPPGTGKTSFIKALAEHTKRHIVSISLALIETNQQLMHIMFDKKYTMWNASPIHEPPSILPFDSTIFVFEDVDAAGDVVLRREPPSSGQTVYDIKTAQHTDQFPPSENMSLFDMPATPSLLIPSCSPASPSSQNVLSQDPASHDSAAQNPAAHNPAARNPSSQNPSSQNPSLQNPSSQNKCTPALLSPTLQPPHTPSLVPPTSQTHRAAALLPPSPLTEPTNSSNNTSSSDNNEESERDDNNKGNNQHRSTERKRHRNIKSPFDSSRNMTFPFHPGKKQKTSEKQRKPKDALNLAGLLNVLDGVVDTPGRIVVMTSNHPGKLDPALTRPGRINKHVYMGRLQLVQALEMVCHYFPKAEERTLERFSKAWVDGCWSPAELEALCAEYQSAQELVQRLKQTTGQQAGRQ